MTKRSRLASLVALSFVSAVGFAKPPSPTPTGVPAAAAPVPGAASVSLETLFAPYFVLLRAHVHGGRVDYAGLRHEGFADLKSFVSSLDRIAPESLADERSRFALYLHAYNAFALFAAVERYPLTSVKNVPGFFTERKHRIGGRAYSLDELEHEVLQKRFADPRMHFALVCGAMSCPVLDPGLTAAERFEEGLEEGSRRFVADESHVAFDEKAGVLRLSPLFDWFRADFDAKYGSVEKFLALYLPDAEAKRLASRAWKKEYNAYDWSLNGN